MVIGVAGVAITGWERLDALIGLAVAVNIVVTGSSLVRRSVGGLMDSVLGEPERRQIEQVLAQFERAGVRFHALRTRGAGQRVFVSLHVLVPGACTVQRGHDLVEQVEAALRERLPYATFFTHLEPKTRGPSTTPRSTVPNRRRDRATYAGAPVTGPGEDRSPSGQPIPGSAP